MIDPEQVSESRREIAEQRRAAAAAAAATPTKRNDQAGSGAAVATERLLAAMRVDDPMHQARTWLLRARSDRRPGTVLELRQAIAEIAAADGTTVEQVRDGIARALEVEGRSLAQWEATLRNGRRPVLGRTAFVSAAGRHPAANSSAGLSPAQPPRGPFPAVDFHAVFAGAPCGALRPASSPCHQAGPIPQNR